MANTGSLNTDLLAKVKLANKYRVGRDVQQDLPEAIRLYKEISAIEKKDTPALTASELDAYGEATFFFGNMYFEGIGVNQNYQKARELYSKGASTGYYPSIKALAEMYKSGQGGKKDSSHADYLFRISEEFYDEAVGMIEAKYKIAYRFWKGSFVAENEQKAFALFQEIAESNRVFSDDKKYKYNALKNMAIFYEKGYGQLGKNAQKAKELRRIAEAFMNNTPLANHSKEKDIVLNTNVVANDKIDTANNKSSKGMSFCLDCNQSVKPVKKFGWLWLIVWMVCTGGPIGFFVYIIYYFVIKPSKCPICGGDNFLKP